MAYPSREVQLVAYPQGEVPPEHFRLTRASSPRRVRRRCATSSTSWALPAVANDLTLHGQDAGARRQRLSEFI
jgi:hypothetical protein